MIEIHRSSTFLETLHMVDIDARLKELGIHLLEVPLPAGNYVPCSVAGGMLFVSGHLPMVNGKPQSIGKVGREYTIEQGQESARICGLNILAHVKKKLDGDWGKIKCLARLGVFVNASDDFTDHPKVANGVSDMMVNIFGEGKIMYAVRLILVCLLSLSIGIPCHAATFEKVSSSFSVFRDVHLTCTPSNEVGLDAYINETVDDFDTNSINAGYTPFFIEKGSKTAKLMSLNFTENAETVMYYDGPGGGGNAAAARVKMDGSAPYHNRVLTTAFHSPIIEFWQPGWYKDHTYFIDLAVRTEATAYYKIAPLTGEKTGDEITLTVEGWAQHEENSTGPGAFANHINYLMNTAGSPGFSINPSNGGSWHTIDGTTTFTARIGDIIGMRTLVESSVGPIGGGIASAPMVSSYMPCGLFASSSVSVSLPLPVPPGLPGDINADEFISLDDAILGLQVVSGLNPNGIRPDYVGAKIDVSGDRKIGLEEVIYILQTVAGLR
jgi:enamine deaminase RidA (YjgF/YER057c/UK114 family)